MLLRLRRPGLLLGEEVDDGKSEESESEEREVSRVRRFVSFPSLPISFPSRLSLGRGQGAKVEAKPAGVPGGERDGQHPKRGL